MCIRDRCCLVWHIPRHEVDACESTHGIAIVNRVLRRRVRQVEPDLKQIHPQHFLDPHRWASAFSGWIVWLNDSYPLVPRDDFIHDFQKFFPLCFLLPAAVFHVRKCFLFHSCLLYTSVCTNPRCITQTEHYLPPLVKKIGGVDCCGFCDAALC